MGRSPAPRSRDDDDDDENKIKKGAWTPEEDQQLINYIQSHGHGSWRSLPKHAGTLNFPKLIRMFMNRVSVQFLQPVYMSNIHKHTIDMIHQV